MDPNQQPYNPQQYGPQPQQPGQPQPNPQQPQVTGQQPFFNAPFTPPETGVIVAPQNTPESPNTPDGQPKSGPKKPLNKTVLGLGIAVVILSLLVLILLIAVSSKPKTATKAAGNTSQSESSDTANATSVQQTDNLISQDISGLNEAKDFSANPYASSALGL